MQYDCVDFLYMTVSSDNILLIKGSDPFIDVDTVQNNKAEIF